MCENVSIWRSVLWNKLIYLFVVFANEDFIVLVIAVLI
jgi:hypothetical protein